MAAETREAPIPTAAPGKPEFKPGRDFLLAFAALCTLSIAVSLDATTLAVALPDISIALGGTALEAFWSGTSFLLASTVLQPTLASLSAIFGRKQIIYASIVFFAAGSLVGALANNFSVLIAGRTIQGIGGGGLIAITEITIVDLVPLAHRGEWFSFLSAVWAVGTVFGPLVGAGFAQNITWRWIFYINLPIIGLGLVLIFLFLHQTKIPGGIGQKMRRVDLVGCVLFTASLTTFLYGLTTGGVQYEWSSFRIILPMILGVAGLVVFGWYEAKWCQEPMIDRRLFVNWDLIASYITTTLHAIVLWSLLYFLILYYQAVKFYSPIVSALAGLPETLTVMPGAMAVGIIVSATGHYRWSVWLGWVVSTLGMGLLLLLGPETTVVQWIFLNIPVGLGLGMLFPAMELSIQAACEPALNGQSVAFYSFLRGFGQTLGVALSGVIFQNVFRQKLDGLPAFAAVADEFSRDATIVVSIINAMEDGPDKTDLVLAFSDAIHIIWATMAAICGLGMLLGFTIKGFTLNQEHVTQQGLVERHKLPHVEGANVKDSTGESVREKSNAVNSPPLDLSSS